MTNAIPIIEILNSPRYLSGTVQIPGSKSITNRALLVSALAHGKSHLSGVLMSDDTIYMMKALSALGIQTRTTGDTDVEINGQGRLKRPTSPIYLGNAGTAMRFLTAACSLVEGEALLYGDEHMLKRPIYPLVDTLKATGVQIVAPTGCPPCTIHGRGRWDGGIVQVSGVLSSQFVSALMMIAPLAERATTIKIAENAIDAAGYLDITRSVMKSFGAEMEQLDGQRFEIASTGYVANDLTIEPDASAATYFWAAEVLTKGAIELEFSPSTSSQPDAAAYRIIRLFPELPTIIDGSQMQDSIPTLAVLAAFGASSVRFTGISNLRVKECDRISALHAGLNRIRPGTAFVERDDLIVNGDANLSQTARPCTIDSMSDHRIAMSFTLAGLKCKGIKITEPECVNKTFPNYWNELSRLGVSLSYGLAE